MLTPAYATLLVYLYPLGNTPAVCLTQGLPPEKQADILLLGCGDVRNILFTVHADDRRRMDITCCDIESSIIARNILLLSLIIDDTDGQRNADNWDIYYHVFLNPACHDRLLEQAKKLHGLAASLETWRASKYGELIRFCDSATLTRVAQVWAVYVTTATPEKQQWIKKTFKEAIDARKHMTGDAETILTGLRSATPTAILSGTDMSALHNNFWKHGSTDLDPVALSAATFANPMFVSPDAAARLHYGMDPLLGFHLSAAYAPLATDSPPSRVKSAKPELDRVVAAARAEFYAWSDAFRTHSPGSITLRFFAGDALSLCHTLQNGQVTGASRTAFWYRSRHNTLDPLVLDEGDYGSSRPAPTSFNVIDTSNLIDHVGALNLLIAVSPLLDHHPSSSLYTETLVGRGKDSSKELLDDLLCGRLPDVSLLLGILPVEYWTNTSPSSVGDEQLMTTLLSRQEKSSMRQLHSRITWKRPPCGSEPGIEPLHIAERDLASLLYRIYLRMFPGEDVAKLLSMGEALPTCALPLYTRPGFVAFVRFVKSRVVTRWDEAMDALLTHIESDRGLALGSNFLQELYLYMHLLDVRSVEVFKHPPSSPFGTGFSLLGWENMPPSVCITLKVPRSALRPLTETNLKLASTVPVQCQMSSSGSPFSPGAWRNIFAGVQLGFGNLSTSGSRFSNAFKLALTDDARGWHGDSPLVVYFRVPSWAFLVQPHTAKIAFGLQTTPITVASFRKRLGLELSIFETTLGDNDHVYITKDLPNQSGIVAIQGPAKDDTKDLDSPSSGAKTTITVNMDSATTRIVSLTARVDIISDGLRSALNGGCPVQAVPLSPCTFTVSIDKTSLTVTFPLPVMDTSLKTRIARKSSYIELIAQVVGNPDTCPSALFTAPVVFAPTMDLSQPVPVTWSTPRVILANLPIIDISNPSNLSWLSPHVSQMFSARECSLRERDPGSTAAAASSERTRLALKESLHCLFMQYPGLAPPGGGAISNPPSGSTKRQTVFCLADTSPGGAGIHIVLFISSLRLDLASRTVLLDCALLILTHPLLRDLELCGFLAALQTRRGGFVQVRVDPAELRLWKAAIPAWVERCRAGWAHRSGCEYYSDKDGRWRAPRSVEEGEEVVCGCGKGAFPDDWRVPEGVPMWEAVRGHCVRAAISPLFASALVEEVVPDLGLGEGGGSGPGQAKGEGRSRGGCRACGKEKSKDGGELKGCSKCLKVKYCGRACQRADWKRHKSECLAKEA